MCSIAPMRAEMFSTDDDHAAFERPRGGVPARVFAHPDLLRDAGSLAPGGLAAGRTVPSGLGVSALAHRDADTATVTHRGRGGFRLERPSQSDWLLQSVIFVHNIYYIYFLEI